MVQGQMAVEGGGGEVYGLCGDLPTKPKYTGVVTRARPEVIQQKYTVTM